MLKESMLPFCFFAVLEIPHLLKHECREPDNSEKHENRLYESNVVDAYRIVLKNKPRETFAMFATLVNGQNL